MPDWLIDVASWSWARHHNILSWYVRPLFLLPFCFFAYRRGLVASRSRSSRSSRRWRGSGARAAGPGGCRDAAGGARLPVWAWTVGKIVIALLVPVVFGGIAVALWRRSIGWALVVINGAVLFKVAWTYFFDAEGAGADAHLPAALVGLSIVDVALVLAIRWLRRRHAEPVGVR
jgi:hypothetical protein